MKKTNESLFSFALTGAGIGFPVTVLCMTLIGGFNQASRELLIWLAASVLFGLISGLFFQNLNLKLFTATALHFICCLAIASLAGWLCGYAESFLGAFVYQICGRIAYDNVELILNRVEKRYRVMVFDVDEIVFVVHRDEKPYVIIVTAFFSDTLEIILKHRNEVNVILIAGEEYLAALRSVLAYMLYNSRAENTSACARIENSVGLLGGIKLYHFCHKSRCVFLGEDPA